MSAAAFLVGTASLAVLIAVSTARYLGAPLARTVSGGLVAWLAYVGALSVTGVVGNPSQRPPGVLFVVVPVIVFMVFFAVRSERGGAIARALPLWLLTGVQVFRVGVELGLHGLWEQGLVPRLMTYEGGNVDIFIALSAPLVAWLAWRGRIGRGALIAWNALGLLALLNIVARSALTAPGALNFVHAEVPNLAIGTFPYTYIAGFFAPLAVFLHVLSIRHLRRPSEVNRPLAGVGQFGGPSNHPSSV